MIAIIATGFSISLGISKLQIEKDKMFKELFQEFNLKYKLKFNKKLQRIVDGKNSPKKEDTKKVDDKDSSKREELIIDYLNFCAEEYLWYTKGRIPEEVWESWKNGMIYYFKSFPINKIVRKESNKKNSYYGLFKILEKELKFINNFANTL